MKRKMLEDMGLTKEQVDQIMDANGEDINTAKGELDTVKQELETTKTQLQEANTTIDGFKDYDTTVVETVVGKYINIVWILY